MVKLNREIKDKRDKNLVGIDLSTNKYKGNEDKAKLNNVINEFINKLNNKLLRNNLNKNIIRFKYLNKRNYLVKELNYKSYNIVTINYRVIRGYT